MDASQQVNRLWNELNAAWQRAESEWQDKTRDEFLRQHWEPLELLSNQLIQILVEIDNHLDDLSSHSRYI